MEWGGGSINKQTGNEGIPRTNMRGKKAASEQVKDVWSLGFCLAAETHQPTYTWSFFNPHRVFQISIRQCVIPLHSMRSDSYRFNSEKPGQPL